MLLFTNKSGNTYYRLVGDMCGLEARSIKISVLAIVALISLKKNNLKVRLYFLTSPPTDSFLASQG